MYEEFYKLKLPPFRVSPDPAFLCMTEQHREALSGLVYSVSRRPGISVMIGEAGTGKTTLLYTLVGMLERRQYLVVMCTNPTLTREEFYEFLLLKAGVNCPSSSKARQLGALEEMLQQNRAHGRFTVLILDEAQRLSAELLEEVRLLSNLETPREKLMEIVLAGQPELGETLRRQEFRQLKQRVSCICTLQPLNLAEVREYIQHRLLQAGLADAQLFSNTAIESIHDYSGGIPRLINTIADTALRTGFALQLPTVTPMIVDEAARELDLTCATAPPPSAVEPNETVASLEARLKAGLSSSSLGRNVVFEGRVPLESYATRQRSLGFFSQWISHSK